MNEDWVRWLPALLPALLVAISRSKFELHALDPDFIANQQRVADTFFTLGLLPHAVKISDAVVPISN